MIGAWMLYALAVGALLALAAAAADAAARYARRATRFVWAAAMLAAAALPALLAARAAARGAAGAATAEEPSAGPLMSAVRIPAIVVRPDGRATLLDRALLVAWAAASVAGLAWCAAGAWRLRRMRRGWSRAVVDGVSARVSADVGPAVLGVAPAEIVLPRWATELPREQRALVLAHEWAHVEARDPALLLAATVLVWLAPWNAALWYALARLRAAIELDCDARVLDVHPRPRAYATLLLDVSERALALADLAPLATPQTPALARSASLLARRITAMTSSSRRPRFTPLRGATCATLALALVGAAASAPSPIVAAAAPIAQVARQKEQRRADTTRVYRESDVDTAVAVLSMAPAHYPDSLRARKVGGYVLLQFVVDTAGRAEPATLRVLQSTNALFTRAATAAVATARFKPASKHGHPVRQVVQLPFAFAMK